MTVEEGRHALNDAWRIDGLTLKIFHYVQEPVIHVRLVDEPNLHLVEIAERIIQYGLLTLRQSRNIARHLRTRAIKTHHGLTRRATRMLQIRPGRAFAVLHLRAIERARTTWLRTSRRI